MCVCVLCLQHVGVAPVLCEVVERVGSPGDEREEVCYEPLLAELEVVRVTCQELELASPGHGRGWQAQVPDM